MLNYQINVITSNDINQTLNTLTISPSNPLQINNDIKMVAKIIGDLPGVKPPPDLSNKILLIPTRPVDHPWVLAGMGQWMLIDREMIGFNGDQCNQIGVGYTAFQT